MDDHLKQLTAEIYAQGYVMSLGIMDPEGVWVADVTYTYDDDFNIYWMSLPKQRHSRAIGLTSAQVAGTITVSNHGDPNSGVQLSGQAEQVDDIPEESLRRYFVKRNKPMPQPGETFGGESRWYKFTPDRIELIHEKEFGYNRQKVR
jgi:uncharacterized protein YhbP (UPF0306 family)